VKNHEEDLAIALADLSPEALATEYEARCHGRSANPDLRRVPDVRIEMAAKARWADVAPYVRRTGRPS